MFDIHKATIVNRTYIPVGSVVIVHDTYCNIDGAIGRVSRLEPNGVQVRIAFRGAEPHGDIKEVRLSLATISLVEEPDLLGDIVNSITYKEAFKIKET